MIHASTGTKTMFTIALRKLRTFVGEVKSKGFLCESRIVIDRAFVAVLANLFRFPASWHPPTSMRPYRKVVAKTVNALSPNIVCEVGCGLGSILSRLHAPVRVGYDISPGVIRAARLIRSRSIDFRLGSLENVDLLKMDVLVLVNWIHEVSPEELERQLLPLLPKTRFLMLDAIDPENTFGYRYKHDFAFLSGRAQRISTSRHPAEGRSFQLYQVGA
mgnify:CR=1 FL=1